MTKDIRPICDIANEISQNWKNVNFAAKPYLSAMFSLNKVTDKYGMDDGKSIILYFLCNAFTWRGEIARKIKKELKSIIH